MSRLILMCNVGSRGHFWNYLGQFFFSTNMQMWVGTRQKIAFRQNIATTVREHEAEEKPTRKSVEINLTNNKQQYHGFLLLSLISLSQIQPNTFSLVSESKRGWLSPAWALPFLSCVCYSELPALPAVPQRETA